MRKQLPQSFVAFLKSILQAQTSTDRWKSKLFYIPPEQIIDLLRNQKLSSQDQEQDLTLKNFISFIERNSQQKNIYISEQSQKVLRKYFKFYDFFKCSKEKFINKLKPTDNKLILQIQKGQVDAKSCILELLKSILQGYKKIKQKREQCKLEMDRIVYYFKCHLYSTCLSKQSLKEFMYEAKLYGRVNFNYIKEYIFGQDQEKMQWTSLFRKVANIPDEIRELSEENIISQNQIPQTFCESQIYKVYQNKFEDQKQQESNQNQKSLLLDSQNQRSLILESQNYKSQLPESQKQRSQLPESQNQRNLPSQSQNYKSLLLESVVQQKIISEPTSKLQTTVTSSDYSNVLNEISHIQQLLNKTKSKYQKDKQQLQNEGKQIINSQIRRTQINQKFALMTFNGNQNMKVGQFKQETPTGKFERGTSDMDKRQTQQTKTQQPITQQSIIRQLTAQETESTVEKQSPLMIQSSVKPYTTRQQMKNKIDWATSQLQRPQRFGCKNSEVRQAGKIKRRSASKDIEKQSGQIGKNDSLTGRNKNDYSQHEAVLREIRKDENQYIKLVQQRQKVVLDRQINQKPDLNAQRTSYTKYTPVNSLVGEEIFLSKKGNYLQRKSSSQSRFKEIMKQVQHNSLSRSRVPSKKKQQIIQKATSEARSRIQQIQSRALDRLARLDTQTTDNIVRKRPNYTNIDRTKRDQTVRIKSRYNTENTRYKTPLNLQGGKFIMNDLLNDRSSLKISPSSYLQKY